MKQWWVPPFWVNPLCRWFCSGAAQNLCHGGGGHQWWQTLLTNGELCLVVEQTPLKSAVNAHSVNDEQVLSVSGESFRENVPPLTCAADLFAFLAPLSVTIRESIHGFDRPVAIVQLISAFEDEHCVGILTDGERVIGLGYAYPTPDIFGDRPG